MKMKQLLVTVLCVLSFFGNAQSWDKIDNNGDVSYVFGFKKDTVRNVYYAFGALGVYQSVDVENWTLSKTFPQNENMIYYWEGFPLIGGCDDETCFLVYSEAYQEFYTLKADTLSNSFSTTVLTDKAYSVKKYDSVAYFFEDSDFRDDLAFQDSIQIEGLNANTLERVDGGENFAYLEVQQGFQRQVVVYDIKQKKIVDTLPQELMYNNYNKSDYGDRYEFFNNDLNEGIFMSYYDPNTQTVIYSDTLQTVLKGYVHPIVYKALDDESVGVVYKKEIYVFKESNELIKTNFSLSCGESLEAIVNDSTFIIFSNVTKGLKIVKNGKQNDFILSDDSQLNANSYYILKDGVVGLMEFNELSVFYGDDFNTLKNTGITSSCTDEYNDEYSDDMSNYMLFATDDSLYYANPNLAIGISSIPFSYTQNYFHDGAVIHNDEFYAFGTNKDDYTYILEKYNPSTKTKSNILLNTNKSISPKMYSRNGKLIVELNSWKDDAVEFYWLDDKELNYISKLEQLNDTHDEFQYEFVLDVDVHDDTLIVTTTNGDYTNQRYEYSTLIDTPSAWDTTYFNSMYVDSKVEYNGKQYFVGNFPMRFYQIDENNDTTQLFIETVQNRYTEVFVHKDQLYVSTIQGLYKYSSTIDGTFSFQKVEEKNYIYPNPSTGKLFLDKSKLEGVSEYSLYDLAGNKVETGNVGADELNLSVESGMYILNLVGEEKVYSQKIIIE